MPSRLRPLRVAMPLLIAGTVISSCGGGNPAPKALPLLPTSTHPSSPEPPSTTAAATSGRQQERAAATALVRRYYDIANDLRRDMNANALAALFTASCPCLAQARAIRSAPARHEHYVDQAHIIVIRPSVESSTRASVLVDINISRGGLVRADGSHATSSAPRRHVDRVFRLTRSGGSWRIDQIEAVS